jgi:hypothetical protein
MINDREKILRLRLNQTEFQVLIRAAEASNTSPSALLRAFIHANAPK